MIGIYIVALGNADSYEDNPRILGAFIDKGEAEQFADQYVEFIKWTDVVGSGFELVIEKWHGGTESTRYIHAVISTGYLDKDNFKDSIEVNWVDGRHKSIPAY